MSTYYFLALPHGQIRGVRSQGRLINGIRWIDLDIMHLNFRQTNINCQNIPIQVPLRVAFFTVYLPTAFRYQKPFDFWLQLRWKLFSDSHRFAFSPRICRSYVMRTGRRLSFTGIFAVVSNELSKASPRSIGYPVVFPVLTDADA
jgi:hypothetical protein